MYKYIERRVKNIKINKLILKGNIKNIVIRMLGKQEIITMIKYLDRQLQKKGYNINNLV